jgi:hypothetical protein
VMPVLQRSNSVGIQISRKLPLGRLRRRCEDNIKMDLMEIYCGGRRMMELLQNHIQCRILVIQVWKLGVPLPCSLSVNEIKICGPQTVKHLT